MKGGRKQKSRKRGPKRKCTELRKVPLAQTKANSGGADQLRASGGFVSALPYASSFLFPLTRFSLSRIRGLTLYRAPTRNCSVSTQAYSRDDRRCAGWKRFKKGVVCRPWRASQTSPACYVGAVGKSQASISTGRLTGSRAAACMTDRIIFCSMCGRGPKREKMGATPAKKTARMNARPPEGEGFLTRRDRVYEYSYMMATERLEGMGRMNTRN